MISSENLCMSCMREIGNEKKCPHCGFHVDTVQQAPRLPIRTVIGNRYLVGRALEVNGEGATYIGWDMRSKKAVNIREFMPDAFTTRTASNLNLQVMLGSEGTFAELRHSFEELWSRLAQLNGLSALINVTDVIEDLGTSFAVYDHFDGISLRDFLLRSKTGYVPWEKARQLLMPTLSTLGTLHKNGIIHRGISPSTLIIAGDGRLKITGFSIGELRTTGSRLSPQIFDGYAAVEQCGYEAQQGPWTDIYAFTAVLYRTLIGSDPIPSKERMSNDRLMIPGRFAEQLPAYVINGIINGLQILPQERTKTVEQLRSELSASPSAAANGPQYQRQAGVPAAPSGDPLPKPVILPQKKKHKKFNPGAVVFITILIVLLVGAASIFLLGRFVLKDGDGNPLISFSSQDKDTGTTVAESDTFEIGNYVGRPFSEIKDIIGSNLVVNEQEEFSDSVTKGYVISQSRDEGNVVEKGTTITIIVSKGPEVVTIPENLIGKNFQEVKDALEELGLTVEGVPMENENGTDQQVFQLNVNEGEQINRSGASTIKVYYYTAPTTALDPQNDESTSYTEQYNNEYYSSTTAASVTDTPEITSETY